MFLRISQICGDKRRGLKPMVPVSRSTWWLGVKEGKFPKPIKLGERTTVWREEDVRALLNGPLGCAHTEYKKFGGGK